MIWDGLAATKGNIVQLLFQTSGYLVVYPFSCCACIFYTDVNGSYVGIFSRESTPHLVGKFMCRSFSLFPTPVQGEIEM